MNKVSSNKIGLVLGGILALWHALWAVLVLAGVAKPIMDWILKLHFLNIEYSLNDFDIVNAVLLVLVTGAIGYILGVIVGWLWNMIHDASHR